MDVDVDVDVEVEVEAVELPDRRQESGRIGNLDWGGGKITESTENLAVGMRQIINGTIKIAVI